MSEKAKHTPGPWEAFETPDGHEIRMVPRDRYAKNHQLVEYDHGCFEDNGVSPEQSEEARANAHLIAAAPDLLNALEEILESHEGPPPGNCSCHLAPPCGDCVEWLYIREARETAAAAIAKAKGGSNV